MWSTSLLCESVVRSVRTCYLPCDHCFHRPYYTGLGTDAGGWDADDERQLNATDWQQVVRLVDGPVAAPQMLSVNFTSTITN